MGRNKNSLSPQTTREEREQLANQIKVTLVSNNYGFAKSSKPRPPADVITFDNVTQLRAIRELFVRLAVYVAKGTDDTGTIDFPECNRKIVYHLSGKCIGNCSIKMKALSNEKPYIFS